MKVLLHVLVALFFSGFSGFSVATDQKKSNEIQYDVSSSFLSGKASHVSTDVIEGELSALYVQGKSVVFRKGSTETVLDDDTKFAGEQVWLEHSGNYVYAFWWNKTLDAKRLFVRVSDDYGVTFKDKQEVVKGAILPQLEITSSDDGFVAVAFVTEKLPGYQIYLTRSLDGGKKWLDEPVRLNDLYDESGVVKKTDAELVAKSKSGILVNAGSNALEPQLYSSSGNLVALWEEKSNFEGKEYLRFVSKYSKDGGSTWLDSNSHEIYRLEGANPVELKSLRYKQQVFLIAFVPNQGLLLFTYDFDKNTWGQSEILDGSQSLNFASWFSMSVLEDNLFFTYSQRREGEKDKVMLAKFSISENKWLSIPMDINDSKNGKKLEAHVSTKSVFSTITTTDSGDLLIAWEDYRYLMPTVMMSLSQDKGSTWLKAVPVTMPGKRISRGPSFVSDGEESWLLFSEFLLNNQKKQKELVYMKIKDGTLPTIELKEDIGESERLALLKKRSEEFWNLRIEEKYAQTWDYFDPMYKNLYEKNNWIRSQGKILFLTNKDNKFTIINSLGYVENILTFTIPQLAIGDEIIEATPPEKRVLSNRWGWFHDNWYFMPNTMFDNRFEY